MESIVEITTKKQQLMKQHICSAEILEWSIEEFNLDKQVEDICVSSKLILTSFWVGA